MHILIVEDESELSENLRSVLESENYTVETCNNGEQALDKIWNETHDLILLDIMLPKLNGLEVLQRTRESGITTPVLMLTAKGDVTDKVQGLNLGADDYLAKPFSLSELLARIRALLRRGSEANPVIECGNISFNTVSRVVKKSGCDVVLTTKEFSILEFLLHNRGRVLSRFVIAEHVWGESFDSFAMSNVVNVHIKNLRKKLQSGDQKSLIKTVRGFGYTIEK
jgi:DNA-binding response OmpR family regulator